MDIIKLAKWAWAKPNKSVNSVLMLSQEIGGQNNQKHRGLQERDEQKITNVCAICKVTIETRSTHPGEISGSRASRADVVEPELNKER